jgi:exosortase
MEKPLTNTRLSVPISYYLPFAVLLFVYLPALYDLIQDWYLDDNYSHGFLVPLVSGYLIYIRRAELAATPRMIDRRGLLLVAVGLLIFVLGNGAAEYFTVRLSLVVTLTGLTLYLFGWELMRKVWFAFFFLLFMIPIPYVIYYAASFPMQNLATIITVTIMKILGLNVVQQGNIIHVPEYSLEVAEACSGIRSLVSLLALGALYAYLTQKRFLPRALLFFSTIPLAVAGNVFRVLITSILAYSYSDAVAKEPLHSLLGLSVFVVVFFSLFFLGLILRQVFK